MDINLEYYKIFYYVGKYKNITQAAAELTISQPAVSQAIKHLEEMLGITLFVRTSKGVRLTVEGSMFYTYIARGYEYIQLGEKRMHELQNMEVGEIRIGASDMTLQFYLLSYLEQFHEKYPKIKVIVTNAPTPETIQHLISGKIDFGIISTPVQTEPYIKLRSVREIEDIFVAGKKFEYLKEKILKFKELEKLPIMYLEGRTSSRTYVEDFLKQKEVVLHPEFELATTGMLIQFALKSLGVASVVKDFALEGIASGELFQMKFEQEIPKREFCVATNERIPISSAAETLMSFLKSEIS